MRIARHFSATVLAATLVLLAAGSVAFAHVGLPGHVHGVLDGMAHPLTGLDHLAAMLAVGLWSSTLGRRALLAVPATFVGLLVVGAGLAAAGIPLPGAEWFVTLSVIVIGLFVALEVRIPIMPAALIVGLFAVFHGYQHGAEMPGADGGVGYALGFMATTAMLHVAGIGIGLGFGRFASVNVPRLIGGGIAALGLVLAVAG